MISMNEAPSGSTSIIHTSASSSLFSVFHLYLSEHSRMGPFCRRFIIYQLALGCACLVVVCWSFTYLCPANLRSCVFTFANHSELLVRCSG